MRYSGKTKLQLADRLGKEWRKLADYFEIEVSDRGNFEKGYECSEILEWLDCRNRLDELTEGLDFIRRGDLVKILEPEVEPTTNQENWTGSPYPGLMTFKPDEARIFFGRDKEIRTLIERLEKPTNRFLAVIGASGSGKSSLVAAGLIPKLKEIAEDTLWQDISMTPGEVGDDPFRALAAALKPLLQSQGYDGRTIHQALITSGNIGDLAQALPAKLNESNELLVFIDQFEELFTQVAEEHRKPFTILLGKLAKTPGLRIILTLRADFYHRCLEFPSLEKLLQLEAATYPLGAPDQWALMDMITGPAAEAGLSFGADLPGRILRDTGSEPGSLALMAFALAELYQQCQPNKLLTHADYESFGRVSGAIAQRAEAAHAELADCEQQAFGDVFTELVEFTSDRNIPTRKHARLSRFESPAVHAFIEKFASPEVRLLVIDDRAQGEPIAEVAHEALLTHWPRLSDWIEERRDDFRLRRQLQDAALDWEAHGHTQSYFWSNERVMEARAMLVRLGYQPSALELEFLGPIDPANMLEEIENPETSHLRRALIGVRLALIGDPRPGVGLRPDGLPDSVWCEVPGGEIILEDDSGTFPVERFYIAKYPVTWIQYRAFLSDPEGFKQADWWEGLFHQYRRTRPPVSTLRQSPRGQCILA